MADTTENQPQVVEVETIDTNMTIDPNDSIFDENNVPLQTFDREKNIIYKVKGKENPLEDAKPADEKKQDSEKKSDASTSTSATDASATDKKDSKEDDEEEEFDNAAAYVLNKIGYSKDEIDFGPEGGGKVKIADLTEAQQIDVLVEEFEKATEESAAKIKELESRTPELKFDDPMAQQIVEYLKNGGDIKKLAKEIISKDPAAQAKIMTDEEVVRAGLKKEFPSFSDKDIEDEFKEMSPDKVARRAKAIRDKMEKERPDFSNLTKEQQDLKVAELKKAKEDFDADINVVRNAAKKMEKIAGIPMTEQLREYLVNQTTPKSMEEDSAFISALDGNPDKLLTLQFWDSYGEKLVQQTAEYYYRKGLAEAQAGKEKLSDEPIRTYAGSGKKPGSNSSTPLDLTQDKDFEKFLNAEF